MILGKNGTNGKVSKIGTTMLNFPKPQTRIPHPKILNPQPPTPNANLENVLF